MTTVSVGTPSAQAAQKNPPRPATSTDPLPPQARAKLVSLQGQAADARDAAQSAHARFADLRQLDHAAMRPEQAASAQIEMNRLLQVRRAQNERHSQLEALVSTLAHWLRTLPPNVYFDLAKPVVAKPRGSEALSEAIARTRDEITAARQHLQAVKSAPLPRSDLKKEAARFVNDLAQKGKPHLSGNLTTFSPVFDDGNSYGPPGIKSFASMLAWLNSDQLIAAFEREIDKLPEPKLALSVKEKEKRTRELKANLDTLERTEEALVTQAIAAGQDVLRRVDASPMAILGIVFRQKIERVRLK